MESPTPTPESEVSFVPENLTRPCCIEEKVIREIFPKPFIIEDGLFKIPNEYIVMSDVGVSLGFLSKGKTYRLEKDGHTFNVNVSRINKCGDDARTFVLLEEINGQDLRGLANFDQLDVFDVEIGNNLIGQIHPGPTGGSGSSEGYPNAYGINRPLPPGFEHPNLAHLREEIYPLDESCSIKVAVLDTGLLTDSDEQTVDFREGQCKNSSDGWNFVADNFNVNDKHADLHGTRISLIVKSICKDAEIIPIKTALDSGACELYNILCGLEYARINEARVINASFSFKISPEKSIPLLKSMMKALKKANIWVIAAAGNAGQYTKDARGNTPPLGDHAPLNLPACYSRDSNKNRVVTVTTVSCTRKIKQIHDRSKIRITALKLGECYSKKFVDVGAIANGFTSPPLLIDDHTFAAPGFEPKPGTSYATAYITGLVANILRENRILNKKQLMRALKMEKHNELRNGIRDGNCIEVELPC